MRDHDPNVVREFLGTFDRSDTDSVPLGFFRDSRNIRFITGGVKSREGTSLDTTIGSVKRMAIYKRIGEAQRLLILDGSGNLYDSTNLSTPILSIVAMTDFSVEVMFDRAYITPHDGITGLPGEVVYVYEGSGTARPTAGNAPSSSTLSVASSGLSGNCEAGIHIYAVAFETESGYITAPGGFKELDQVGGFSTTISSIPLGPAGTAARVLLATKRILSFNGDYENQEYFLVPNGRLGDNTGEEHTVSFFDADLISSADYLFDQLAEIPAGVGIRNYGGRLCVWGENANPSIIRVSKAGEPESHDAVEGYLTVNPGDSGGGVKNVAVYRTQLLAFKSERSYVTQDNGENAAFWKVDDLDTSVGTECHALARVRDFGDNLQDRLFIASRQGFHIFAGTFSDTAVSDTIDAVWDRITKNAFHTIECAIDPVEALVYVAIPLDGATAPSHLLVGDFQEGFARLKWTLWSFPDAPQTIVVDVNNTTKESKFKFGSVGGNVYLLDSAATDDYGTAIGSYVWFPHFPMGDVDGIFHFTGIKLRIKGVGSLDITIYGLDDVLTANPTSLILSAAPGKELFRGFNFTNDRCSVKIGVDGAGERFTLTKFLLYSKLLWLSRPE